MSDGFYQRDLFGQAEMLEISARELVRLGQDVDPRIIAAPSLEKPGARVRLRRWYTAGSPAPDFARLEFMGDDGVRELVLDVVRAIPAPVAWHAVEHVAWFEVGRSAHGWQGDSPEFRTPDGDRPHMIALCGTATNDIDDMRSIIGHELGHSWSRAIHPHASASTRMSRREWNARVLAATKTMADTQIADTHDLVVRERVAFERLANDLSGLWGYPRHTDVAALERHFTGQMAAAADLAAEIDREIDEQIDREHTNTERDRP